MEAMVGFEEDRGQDLAMMFGMIVDRAKKAEDLLYHFGVGVASI